MVARITRLLARMNIEEKVGQVVQSEFKSISPEDEKVTQQPHEFTRIARSIAALE